MLNIDDVRANLAIGRGYDSIRDAQSIRTALESIHPLEMKWEGKGEEYGYADPDAWMPGLQGFLGAHAEPLAEEGDRVIAKMDGAIAELYDGIVSDIEEDSKVMLDDVRTLVIDTKILLGDDLESLKSRIDDAHAAITQWQKEEDSRVERQVKGIILETLLEETRGTETAEETAEVLQRAQDRALARE